MVARRSAAGERTRAINQARALILTGPDDLRPAERVAATSSHRHELSARCLSCLAADDILNRERSEARHRCGDANRARGLHALPAGDSEGHHMADDNEADIASLEWMVEEVRRIRTRRREPRANSNPRYLALSNVVSNLNKVIDDMRADSLPDAPTAALAGST